MLTRRLRRHAASAPETGCEAKENPESDLEQRFREQAVHRGGGRAGTEAVEEIVASVSDALPKRHEGDCDGDIDKNVFGRLPTAALERSQSSAVTDRKSVV